MEVELIQKGAELEMKMAILQRKMAEIDESLRDIPAHAPLRQTLEPRYMELAKEYRTVMHDLMEMNGQIPLFGEGTD